MENVILVNREGCEIGTAEKLAAHQAGGELHLAFSTLVFNARGELLVQQRAASKYHFAGLWSNTCCGHPRPGEAVLEAGERRLWEEFGLALKLKQHAELIYRVRDQASGLVEHEYLHVLLGDYPSEAPELAPNPEEIDSWAWRSLEQVRGELQNVPEHYSPWFPLVLSSLGHLEPGRDASE